MLSSIRTRIMLSHVAIVVLVMLVLGPASYYLLKSQLSKERRANLHFIARHAGDMVDKSLMRMEKQLEQIAGSRVVQDFPETARVAALSEYFGRFKVTFPVLGYLDAKGWEEVKVADGQRLPYLDSHQDHELFGLASAHPNNSLRGDIVVSKDSGDPVMPMIYGIKRYFGDEFVGAVYGFVPLDKINSLLRQIEVGKTGYICLVEHSGRILYYPDSSLILTDIPKASHDNSLVSDALAGMTGVAEGEFLGERGLIAYVTIESLNASLLVVLPHAEMVAAPVKVRNAILLILLVIFIVGGFTAMLLANRLTRPIVVLTDAIRGIAQGDFSAEVKTSADGEIGELVQSFNQMSRELRSSTVSRHYFDRIMSHMQEGLLLIGLDGKIRNANHSACGLIGDAEPSLVGRDLADYFNLPATNAESWLQMLLENPGSNRNRMLLKTRMTGDLPVTFVWSVLEDSDGVVREVACLFLPLGNE